MVVQNTIEACWGKESEYDVSPVNTWHCLQPSVNTSLFQSFILYSFSPELGTISLFRYSLSAVIVTKYLLLEEFTVHNCDSRILLAPTWSYHAWHVAHCLSSCSCTPHVAWHVACRLTCPADSLPFAMWVRIPSVDMNSALWWHRWPSKSLIKVTFQFIPLGFIKFYLKTQFLLIWCQAAMKSLQCITVIAIYSAPSCWASVRLARPANPFMAFLILQRTDS